MMIDFDSDDVDKLIDRLGYEVLPGTNYGYIERDGVKYTYDTLVSGGVKSKGWHCSVYPTPEMAWVSYLSSLMAYLVLRQGFVVWRIPPTLEIVGEGWSVRSRLVVVPADD